MDDQHDPVTTRPRPTDPYWRPGDPEPTAPDRARRLGPVLLMLLGAVAVLTLVVVLATAAVGAVGDIGSGGAREGATTPPPGTAGDAVRVGDGPEDVEVGDDAVWTADRGSGTVTRVDAATGDTTEVSPGGEPAAVVVGRERVWVWNYSSVLTPITLDGRALAPVYLPEDTTSIALSGDTVWFTRPASGSLGRLDARSGAPRAPLPVGGRPDQIAVDGTSVTVLDAAGTVRTVDGATGRAVGTAVRPPAGTTTVVAGGGRRYAVGEAGVAELRAGGAPSGPLRGGSLTGVDARRDAVWLLDAGGLLRRLTPDLRPVGFVPGMGGGGDVAVGPDGRVWVLDASAGTVRAVRPG